MEKTSPDFQTMMMNETSGHLGDHRGDHLSGRPNSLQNFDHDIDDADHDLSAEDLVAEDAVESEVVSAATESIKPQYELEHLSFAENIGQHHGEELSMLSGVEPDANIEAIIEPGVELMESLGAIPDKMAFKIGEAAEMVGVKQYVLRYWETEFEQLRPRKSKNNQRVYSRRDVECAMMIKKLLYDDRFSIEGARAALKQLKSHVKEEKGVRKMAQSQETAVSKLRGIAAEIRKIRDLF